MHWDVRISGVIFFFRAALEHIVWRSRGVWLCEELKKKIERESGGRERGRTKLSKRLTYFLHQNVVERTLAQLAGSPTPLLLWALGPALRKSLHLWGHVLGKEYWNIQTSWKFHSPWVSFSQGEAVAHLFLNQCNYRFLNPWANILDQNLHDGLPQACLL